MLSIITLRKWNLYSIRNSVQTSKFSFEEFFYYEVYLFVCTAKFFSGRSHTHEQCSWFKAGMTSLPKPGFFIQEKMLVCTGHNQRDKILVLLVMLWWYKLWWIMTSDNPCLSRCGRYQCNLSLFNVPACTRFLFETHVKKYNEIKKAYKQNPSSFLSRMFKKLFQNR